MAPLLLALMLTLGSSAPQRSDVGMTLARVETAASNPSTPEFAITLENQSGRDFVLVLAYMLANGKVSRDCPRETELPTSAS
jgi:hypothetical protein